MVFTSCEDFLAVNEDPDKPDTDKLVEATVLPGLEGRWAYNGIAHRGIDAFYHMVQWVRVGAEPTGLWGNDIRPDNSGSAWYLFTDVQKHAVILEDLAVESGNEHYQGIAQVIKAWGWATLTDYFGDIPMTEAFQYPENVSPAYDSQETVYTEVFRLLDAAIANLQTTMDPDADAVGSDDIIYRGDIESWVKLAYSLKARYSIRLCYAPGHTTTAQADAALTALSNGMASSADDANFVHYTGTGYRSAYYEHGPGWTDVQRLTPSSFVVDTMKATNDPRVPVYFDLDANDEYTGWVSGTYVLVEGYYPSFISNGYVGPTYPETIMNYVECKFLEAEAYALKEDYVNAQAAWEDAITSNMTGLGIEQADIDTYIAQFTFPTDVESAQAFIMMQKYVANFTKNSEMYFDFVRTGYPAIHFKDYNVAAISDVTTPHKWPYPTDEQERNVNCPDQGNSYDALTEKVWWDNK